MTTSEHGITIAILVTQAMMLPALVDKWRNDRAGVIKTLKFVGLYWLYIGAGIGFVMVRLHFDPEMNGLAVLVFLFAWILYGVLWLTRTVPRYRPLPAWFDKRFTVVDGVLVAIIVVSLWFCLR
jgi:hypothetical protein